MRRIFAILGGIAAMLIAAPAAAATPTVNGSGQLTGATGVTVSGSTYTVTFTDGTCAGLFSGCDAVSDFTFQTQAAAQAAAAALLAQVIVGTSFDTAPGTTFGCIGGEACSMLIPFGFTGTDFNSVATLNGVAVNSSAIFLNASPTTFDTGTSNARVWALFSLAVVPEPASWAMMLFGFGAMGLAIRRRRIAAPA